MTMPRSLVSRAVRILRVRLCKTQLNFAAELGSTPGRIARYETSHLPSRAFLLTISKYARDVGQVALARFFEAAMVSIDSVPTFHDGLLANAEITVDCVHFIRTYRAGELVDSLKRAIELGQPAAALDSIEFEGPLASFTREAGALIGPGSNNGPNLSAVPMGGVIRLCTEQKEDRVLSILKSCRISRREVEILVCLADGLEMKEVAAKLDISWKTVEAHKAKLFKKTGSHNTVQLVRWAIRSRIIEA